MEKKTILIVDDEEEIREILKEALGENGYNLVFAENGNQALSLALQPFPDLVLLDLKMPKMSGIEFIKNIHQVSKIRKCKPPRIIIVSALADHRNVTKTSSLSISDFIAKPFDIADLILRIKKCLNS